MPHTQQETASWARRVGALIVDWFTCMFVVIAFVGPARYFPSEGDVTTGIPPSVLTLLLFVAETTILVCLAGGSFGQLATRLRVVRYDGRPGTLDPFRSLARAVLIALVIPPLVFRPDGRGLHDLAVGSAVVPLAPRR